MTQPQRLHSHASASTSSPFSSQWNRSIRSLPSPRGVPSAHLGPRSRGTRQSAPPRALPNKGPEQLCDDRGSATPSTSSASTSFLPLATALALAASSLLLALNSPPPCLAENVRVEDVESPALRAGLEAANERRWADAERLFQAFLVEEPDSASGLSNLANVELSTGRPERALKHLDRAVELAPRAAVPRMNRALAKEALAAAAAESKGEGAAAAPSPSSSEKQLLASAAEDARAASLLDPKEFAAFYDLGNILERQRDFEGALAAFTEAADLAPGLPGYRLREAACMFQVAVDNEGRGGGKGGKGGGGGGGADAPASVAKARKLVAGVMRRNPRYAEARAALAAMSWEVGDVSAAEDALNGAVGLEGEWRKPGFAGKVTRWPPRLVEAYERLLAIE